MFKTLSEAHVNGNVGRTPVWVVADAVNYWLGGLSLQGKRLIERPKFKGVVGEPVHGVLLRRHLKQPLRQIEKLKHIINNHNQSLSGLITNSTIIHLRI